MPNYQMRNPMPQNALGIDMGKILSNVSNLKSAKQSREQSAEKYSHYKEDRNLQKARAGKRAGALEKAGLDPDLSNDEIKMIQKKKGDDRKLYEENLEHLGNFASAVQSAGDPSKTYQDGKKFFTPEVQKQMPENYDANWVNGAMSRMVQAKDVLAGKKVKKAEEFKTEEREAGQEFKTEEREAKTEGDIKIEEKKHENRIALEAIKKTKTTKTKLEKLFDLKKKYSEQGETEEAIDTINKAIKLTSEGKPSEADKMMALLLGIDGETPSTPETPTKQRSAEQINKLLQ